MRKIVFGASIFLILVATMMYAYKNMYWFNIAVIGVWLFFDTLSHFRGNKTTLDFILEKDYKKFAKTYLILLLLSILVEVVGSILLKLWSYPKLWSLSPLSFLLLMNAIGYLCYPFILMSFREMYNFIYSFMKNPFIAVPVSMLLGIIIWEVPNIYSQDWIYNVPFVTTEIFSLNIIIILGWPLLILIPQYIYRKWIE